MKDKIIPENCHPEIAKILGEFCEEMLSDVPPGDICPLETEKPTPPIPAYLLEKPLISPPQELPPYGDIDQRLIDYSPEYIEYKPGVVKIREHN